MLRRLQKMMALAMVIALAAAFAGAALAESTAKVVTDSARVYQAASKSSRSVKLRKGTKVTVKSVTGDWAKVKSSGNTGYVPVECLNSTRRYKAYISKKTYVYKKASSSSAKTAVSVNTVVYVVGKSGSFYRVQNASGSRTGYVRTGCVSSKKVSTTEKKTTQKTVDTLASKKARVVKMDWFNGGKSVLKKGGYGYIYDINSGLKIKIKRMGGHNHADVEPATAADTKKLLKASGGKWSWNSRAVILIAGGKYVACAINTMPHGDQTIRDNNYEGQFCLHMTNSLNHNTGKINASHQAAIEKAYKWAH